MIKTTTQLDSLKQFPLFDCLNAQEIEMLSNMVELKVKPRYSYIYYPNDPSDAVMFLVKGAVKICIHSSDGREIIKSVLHPTAMFGELAMVGEERRKDYAQAMNEEVHMLVLKISDLQRLIQSNGQLSLKIITMLGTRLRTAESRLEALIFKDARTRIIDFLKDSVEKRGRRIGYEMLLKHCLTQQDIANITGTSRQTVTSVLNDLRKSDLIYFNRRSILIRDLAKLV
ncbi:MAG: Crp/Fnr family transcriptional regulator [Bacteroidota bacterium]